MAACHNGTMHVTGNITPEMPRVLAREEKSVREREDRIDCEKGEKGGGKRTERARETEGGAAKGFFYIVAVYRREFSPRGDCLFR